jgi:hypothetical protein
MSAGTLELVSQLIRAARYAEAERLVRAIEHRASAAGQTATAHLLAVAREMCRTCQEQHLEMQAHWQAAADLVLNESRFRMRLTAVLGHAVDAADPRDEVGRAGGVPQTSVRAPHPAMAIYGLGPLRVVSRGRDLGAPASRRARSVFKYLLLHRRHPTRKEVLMDLFWPEAVPVAARNNLNVAVHGLRRFLRSADGRADHVLFSNDGYVLNPDLDLWIDIDEFHRHVAVAQRYRASAEPRLPLPELEAAEALYRGSLFADDLYEDWTIVPRRAAEDCYVEVLRSLSDHYHEVADGEARIRVLRKILEVQIR